MSKYKTKPQYRNGETPDFVSPVQKLMDIINNRMDNDISHPAMMPSRQQEAAEWWIERQEPMHKDEKATLEWAKSKGNETPKQYWKTPYHDRLCDTLTIFYKLNHADQMYILDLWSQGIWWRGDSIEFMSVREKVDMNKIDKAKLFSMMKTVIARG